MSEPTIPLNESTGNVLVVGSGSLDSRHEYTELHLPDGSFVRVRTALLQPAIDTGLSQPTPDSTQPDDIVIPVSEEQVVVGKRTVTTGKVRLHKTVQEYEEVLNESLAVRTFDVERVVLNQPVEAAPSIRQEGETTVYPLVEERLILTKQLVLREELRVTRRDTERSESLTVRLRRENVTVEREAGEPLATNS